jgi:hypothetical protein
MARRYKICNGRQGALFDEFPHRGDRLKGIVDAAETKAPASRPPLRENLRLT